MSPAETWTLLLLIWGGLMFTVLAFGRWLDTRGQQRARRRHPSHRAGQPVCPRCGAAVDDQHVHSLWCARQPGRERYEGTDDWDA
jgi:hypothetical protein